MTSVSVGHIIPTPTQPIGSGQPQWGSNPGPPHQESPVLPTELPLKTMSHSFFSKCAVIILCSNQMTPQGNAFIWLQSFKFVILWLFEIVVIVKHRLVHVNDCTLEKNAKS